MRFLADETAAVVVVVAAMVAGFLEVVDAEEDVSGCVSQREMEAW